MATIAEQIEARNQRREELETERNAVAERIAAASHDLDEAQAELDGLATEESALDAEVAAAKQLQSDVDATDNAAREVRERADAELTHARDEHDALKARVEQELSDERRTALDQGLSSVDDAIAASIDRADHAAQELADGEAAATTAHKAEAEAATAFAQARQRLQALPQEADSAAARVASLRAAASDAVGAGRSAEAFARLRDLNGAIDNLEAALRSDEYQRSAGELPALWGAMTTTSQQTAAAGAALRPLKDKAAAAEQERDAALAGRDQSIAGVVSEPPPPAAPAGEPDTTADDAPEPADSEPSPADYGGEGDPGQPDPQ